MPGRQCQCQVTRALVVNLMRSKGRYIFSSLIFVIIYIHRATVSFSRFKLILYQPDYDANNREEWASVLQEAKILEDHSAKD